MDDLVAELHAGYTFIHNQQTNRIEVHNASSASGGVIGELEIFHPKEFTRGRH